MWWNTRHKAIFFLRNNAVEAARIFRGAIEDKRTFPVTEGDVHEAFSQAVQAYGTTGKIICEESLVYVFSVLVSEEVLKDAERLQACCAERFPEEIATLIWDYRVLRKENGRFLIQVSGMRKDFGEQLKKLFEAYHFSAECIVPESYALAQQFLGQGNIVVVQERQGKALLVHMHEGAVLTSQIVTDPAQEAAGFLEYVRWQPGGEIHKIIYVDFSRETDFFSAEKNLQKEWTHLPDGAWLGAGQLSGYFKKASLVLDLKVPKPTFSWKKYFWKA
jgi:hypothetical protein